MQSDGVVYQGVIEIGSRGVCHKIQKQNRVVLLAGRRLRLRKTRREEWKRKQTSSASAFSLCCSASLAAFSAAFFSFSAAFARFFNSFLLGSSGLDSRDLSSLEESVKPYPRNFSSLTLGPLRTWLLVYKLFRLIDLISPSDEAGSVTGLLPAFRTPRMFTDPREKPVDTSTLFSFVLQNLA